MCQMVFFSEEKLHQHISHNHPERKLKEDPNKEIKVRKKNCKLIQEIVNTAKIVVDGKVYYNCKECGRCLYSPYTYIWHMRIHTGERPHTCHRCGKCFRVSQGLVRHLKETHEGIKTFPCCKESGVKITSHEDNFNQTTHPESSNEDTTDNIEEENSIKEYLDAVDLNTNSCVLCKLSFNTKIKLKSHMLDDHQLKPKQTTVRRKKAFAPVFICLECKKSFSRKYDLKRHISKVHPDSYIETSNRHKNYKLLTKHKVIDDGVVYYKCDLCEVKLTKSSSFVDHYNIHLDKKQHCCHFCGKKFRTSSHVNRHINVVHYGIKKYSCDFCEQTFSSKSAKDEHVNTHTNNRPFMCALCGKSFKQSSSLYVHKMFHDQVYRFTCNICNKKFKRGGELKRHQVVHTGKRDFDCEICKKSFRLSTDLKRHLKIHAPYSCDVCGMDFQQSKSFKVHKKDHEKSV